MPGHEVLRRDGRGTLQRRGTLPARKQTVLVPALVLGDGITEAVCVYPSRRSHALITCRSGAGLRGCSREAAVSPGEGSCSGTDSPHGFRQVISPPWAVFFALES